MDRSILYVLLLLSESGPLTRVVDLNRRPIFILHRLAVLSISLQRGTTAARQSASLHAAQLSRRSRGGASRRPPPPAPPFSRGRRAGTGA